MFETNKRLHERYLNILQKSQEFRDIWQSQQKEFSGLFLAGVPDNYESSPNRIMIIGRETRGWGLQFNNTFPLSQYIEAQIKKSREYLINRKEIDKNERGSSFHNFVRELSKQPDKNSVVWANLHCYSWRKGRSDKSPFSKEVDFLSLELLKAQIDILRPQYIIFAHGVAKYSVELRRKLFPIVKCETQIEPKFEAIDEKQIWKFQYQWASDYKVTCFRIQHPSSLSSSSRIARNYLTQYFKASSNCIE